MSEGKKEMSNDTENNFAIHPVGAFDIRFQSCRYALVSRWNYTDITYGIWLFYWNPTEGAFLIQNGKTYALNSRQAVLIPPYTTFSTRNTGDFQHFFIHFEADDPFSRVRREILFFPSEIVRKMFPRLQEGGDETRQKLLLRILLYEYLLLIPESSFLPPGENVLDRRIRKATEVMNQNLSGPHGNRELSRKVGMSLNNFYQLFRQELGTTPKHYLLNQRMEAARKLLVNSESTIDEIAAMTGYADRYHFSKAFKKFYFLPPAAYQQQMCGKK